MRMDVDDFVVLINHRMCMSIEQVKCLLPALFLENSPSVGCYCVIIPKHLAKQESLKSPAVTQT